MSVKLFTVFIVIFIMCLSGCTNDKGKIENEETITEGANNQENAAEKKQENEQYILELYEKQIEAINEGNEEKYMSIVKIDHDSKEDTRAQFLQTQELGIVVEVEEIEVREQTESTADLYVKQKMYTEDDNPDFLDRILEVIHHFEKINGEWKMINSTAVGIHFLEQVE
ncbi:hypothetical protein ACFSTA_19515 [Ornithinibacillus salinisoli]|uniref:Nuclear transport factor 2 family protein n=1 Tax=Ornithinibacillus salinisoli TaxID=1848459 RepID=A0ABW4W466_9BACI